MAKSQDRVPNRLLNLGWPIVAVAATLWGTDLLLRPRILNGGMHPAAIVLGEHALLSLIFLPTLIRYRKESMALKGSEWLGLLFLAWGGSALATILLTIAYEHGNALTATLLQKLQSPIAVALAGIVLKEKRSALFWSCFALALAAAYLISFGFQNPFGGLDSKTSWPTFCALGAAGIWGACTVIGRLSLRNLDPKVVAGWRFVLAVPLLLALNWKALSSGEIFELGLHWANIWPLLLIVIFPDALGMTLYYIGLKRTPASVATLAEMAYPLSALVLGLLFAGQSMNLGQWAGFALLLICLQAIQKTHSVTASDSLPN